MPEITIPTGGPSEPTVFIQINGVEQSQVAGAPFEADQQLLEVLGASHYSGWMVVGEGEAPDGALLHADFANRYFYQDGVAVVGADMFGPNGFVADTLDPDDLNDEGWAPLSSTSLGFLDASFIGTGFTLVADFTLGAGGRMNWELLSPEYDTYFTPQVGADEGDTWVSPDGSNTQALHTPSALPVGTYRLAVLFADDKIAASINGGTVYEEAGTWPETPTMFIMSHYGPEEGPLTLHTLTIYAEVAAAALPGLSTPD